MIHRSIFHVAGPAGGGKTAFIEAVLGMDAAHINCMRAELERRGKGFRESKSKKDVELRRYLEAGAGYATRLRFDETNGDAFYETDLMSDYCESVFIEGDMPAEYADLEVFVGPPPADGKGLVRVGRRAGSDDVAAEDRGYATRSPVGLARLHREEMGDERALAFVLGMDPLRAAFGGTPDVFRARGAAPARAKGAAVSVPRGYEALETAGLCVITVHTAASRDAAVHFADEVRAMRADPELRRRLFGDFSRGVPATIVAADLKDPRDAGTKKALARVRRALRASR